jgi:hypothetical protein
MADAPDRGLVRAALLALMLPACTFPTRSGEFACTVDSDCPGDRFCDLGYCVIGARSDAPPRVDAPTVDAPIDADPFAQIAMQCMQAGYQQIAAANNGLYKTVVNGTSWTNAQADCKNDVANATHLIVLSNQGEVSYMATQLGWIGLSDRANENQFVTVTGETGDLRPFASGQPDDGGGEDCVQMKSGGQLDDDQCGNGHRYVCECDGRMSSP